ncbi:MAG: hypothetical protein AAF696_32430 [Bacteroidota bacterium]
MRKLKKIEKVTLVAFLNLLVILIVLWLMEKKPNRDYYIPKGYEGWVMIHYNIPDKPPLEKKEGVLQFNIPASGIMETNSDLNLGWRRDRFFWYSEEGIEEIPASVKIEDGYHMYIHMHKYYARSHVGIVESLPVGTDTILWDQTHITKENATEVDYMPGKKTLEYFYVSAKPESIVFNPPKNEKSVAIESTESRELKDFK